MKTDNMLALAPRLWRQLSGHRRVQLYLLVTLMFVASMIEALSIGAVVPFLGVLSSPETVFRHPAMAPLVSALGITQPAALIFPVTVIFCVGAIASGVLRYVLLHAQTRLTYSIGVDLSVRIFERTLHQPYRVHVSRNSSEVIAGVSNKANDLIVSLLYPMAVIVSSTIMLCVVLAALVIVEPTITVATIGAFALFYGTVSVVSKKTLDDSGRIISAQYSQVIRLIQEGLGGIRDILLDGTQQTFIANYRTAETSLRNSRATVQIMSGTPRFIIETLGTLFIAALAFRLTTGDRGLSAAIPVLGAVALAAQRLIPVMQQLYTGWAGIVGGYASVHDALNLLEQPMPAPERQQAGVALPFNSEIRLESVGFRYGPDLPAVFRNVNLTIPKGGRVGIIGKTGSGKSTFLDVVMGLIAPTEGNLAVDGHRVETGLLRAWQRNVAHVPQSIYLADSSVAENIAFGQALDAIDLERVTAAAKTAQVYDVIQALPSGFETVVGERGVRLSGGQRQRIGIARALYKDASVIVLDEATNALDGDTESAVMDAIHALPVRITLLIVAHRQSTLRNCTSIVRIGDGGVEVVRPDESSPANPESQTRAR